MTEPVVVKEFPVEEEYKKKTGVTPEDIKKLREWLNSQPHLPGELISDLDLILIYHCCLRSSEVSKQVLDLNYTLRSMFENLFKYRIVDEKLLNTYNVAIGAALPTRTHDGNAVLYCRLVDPDAKKFIFHEVWKSIFMIVDLWQYEEGTWPGFVLVADMNTLSLQHIARLDLQTLQQFFYFLQEAMFVKLKGLHFINAPSFIDKVMMLIKPFMKKALMDSLVIHQVGSTTMEKYMPMEGLPKEAGGKYKSIYQIRDDIQERMKLNADFFVQENKKRVQESKRPGKPKTITDFFGGVEGSFKKLDID